MIFTFSMLLNGAQIERRKAQYNYTPGYFIVPAPYSLPGIGTGVAFVGMATNINNTQTDFIADILTGDVKGYGIGVMQWHPFGENLGFDIFNEGLSQATFQSYSTRGMKSSKDDYVYVGLNDLQFTGVRATLSFYERMLEFYVMGYSNSYSIDNLKDKDENTIFNSLDNKMQKATIYTLGTNLDYTDDKIDPRVGARLDIGFDYAQNNQSDSVDYYVVNYNLTGYIPIGNYSTIALNYFRSDAHVQKEGDTDFNSIEEKMGLDCSTIVDSESKQKCINVVNNQLAANKYGTATSLGGRTRLRSYPESRFMGAHTEFYGAELRWNWTEEATPYDLWFMKDIRTSVQSALFYEQGSVSEQVSELRKDEKRSYGIGVRLLTGSGLVYRLDIADGNEGYAVTMIINYPWELF